MYLIIFLLLLLSTSCFGQNPNASRTKLYEAKVLTLGEIAYTNSGVLYALNDSSISIMSDKNIARKKKVPLNQDLLHIPIRDIHDIRIRKYGAVAEGALVAGLLGGLFGALIGNFSYQPCDDTSGSWFGCIEIFDQGEQTIIGAALGTVIGAGVGTAIGASASTSQKFILNRDLQTYINLKDSLTPYLYVPPALQSQAE